MEDIMAAYYAKCKDDMKPKIFGMTASPAYGGDAREAISTAYTADDFLSLASHVHRPVDEIVNYAESSFEKPILNRIRDFSRDKGKHFKRLVREGEAVLSELGPYCFDIFLSLALAKAEEKRERLLLLKSGKRASEEVNTSRLGASLFEDESDAFFELFDDTNDVDMYDDDLREAKGDIDGELAACDGLIEILADCSLPTSKPDIGDMSPKLWELIKILRTYRDDAKNFCGIVFAEKRATAYLLQTVLQKVDCTEKLGGKTNVFEGYEEDNAGVPFRVAEEGLDVQPCMLVIRFDIAKTLIQHIQSRGRARSSKARYIHMVPGDCETSKTTIFGILEKETQMKDALLNSEEDTGEPSRTHDIVLDAEEEYIVPTTGAKITTLSSVQFLFQYCGQLPFDIYTSNMPEFKLGPCIWPESTTGVGWICHISLPLTVARSIRFHFGQPCMSKIGARRSAAFEAVKKLHIIGELDERLRPVMMKKHVGVQQFSTDSRDIEAGVEKISRTLATTRQYSIAVPKLFSSRWEARKGFLLLLQLSDEDGSRILDFGLIVPARLPEDILQTQEVMIGTSARRLTLHCSQKELDMVDRFDNIAKFGIVLWSGLLRKAKEARNEPYMYLVVPLKEGGQKAFPKLRSNAPPHDLIDWDFIDATALSSWVEKAAAGATPAKSDIPALFQDLGEELVVKDRWYYDRKYTVHYVDRSKNPFNTPYCGFDSLASYYQSRLKTTEDIDEDQPVLLASNLPHIFQTGSSQDNLAKQTVYLIPQFCSPYPIVSSILVRSGLYLPLIIRTLHHSILVYELRAALNLERYVSVNLMTKALTGAGMVTNMNYERLEFLGDSFLKLLISLHIYSHNPLKNEGWLTRSRKLLEQNTNLLAIGEKLCLPQYAQFVNLTRKTWLPPIFDNPTPQPISGKGVADLVEAIIGSCFVNAGVEGGTVAVRKLFEDDSYEVNWERYSELVLKSMNSLTVISVGNYDEFSLEGETAQKRLCQKLENLIGYKFTNPNLAMEALTHASAMQNTNSSCYQRLEFLGDAVLGFLVAAYLFGKYPHASPGFLSYWKMELVNNQFLGLAGFQLGIHKLLLHMNPTLAKALSNFGYSYELIKSINAKKSASGQPKQGETTVPDKGAVSSEAVVADPMVVSESTGSAPTTEAAKEASATNGTAKPGQPDLSGSSEQPKEGGNTPASPLFWADMETVPKAISDCMEALIGAIFLDSKCSLEPIMAVIETALIKPFWPYLQAAGIDKGVLPDTTEINVIAKVYSLAKACGCYRLSFSESQAQDGMFNCSVLKHDKAIGRASNQCKKEAKRLACRAAVPVLEDFVNNSATDENCDCEKQAPPPPVVEDEEDDTALFREVPNIDPSLLKHVGPGPEPEKKGKRGDNRVTEVLMEVAGVQVISNGEGATNGANGKAEIAVMQKVMADVQAAENDLVEEDGLLVPPRKRRLVVVASTETNGDRPADEPPLERCGSPTLVELPKASEYRVSPRRDILEGVLGGLLPPKPPGSPGMRGVKGPTVDDGSVSDETGAKRIKKEALSPDPADPGTANGGSRVANGRHHVCAAGAAPTQSCSSPSCPTHENRRRLVVIWNSMDDVAGTGKGADDDAVDKA
ncbi:Dicer-like protein 1 [Phlyctochytrium bullatum]|nr:Dicer-like protein 1 [Phlyctochytrium bullatum]